MRLVPPILFVILCLVCVRYHTAHIEADLKERTQLAINDPDRPLGFSPSVSFSGQDGVITGRVPDEAVRKQVLEAARAIYGIREIRDQMEVGELPSRSSWDSVLDNGDKSYLNVSFDGLGRLVLTGKVAVNETRSNLENSLNHLMGEGNVVNNLKVGATDLLPDGLADLLGSFASTGASLRDGRMAITRDSVTVYGSMFSSTSREQLVDRFRAQYPNFSFGMQVEVIPPSNQDLQKNLDALVSNQTVQFETGSDRISENSIPFLREVAEILASDELARIEIQGHTDNTGSEAANRSLSQRRAEAVRSFLSADLPSPERLTARGFGSTSPLADNSTEAGRTLNRRVVFVVLN